MERRRNYYDHPGRSHKKSVVREGPRHRSAGGANSQQSAGGLLGFLKKYQGYLILGAGALVVALTYKIYSSRMSKKKDEEQIQNGLRALSGGAEASERAPLQVDPSVIEILQQQVLDYQSQVEQLEYALSQRDLQLEQIRTSGAAVSHPSAQNKFAGLHGQVDPNSHTPPLPMQMQQPIPTRDPSNPAAGLPGGPSDGLPSYVTPGPSAGPGGQVGMGAFSTDPGMGQSGQGGISLSQSSGGSQFTPL